MRFSSTDGTTLTSIVCVDVALLLYAPSTAALSTPNDGSSLANGPTVATQLPSGEACATPSSTKSQRQMPDGSVFGVAWRRMTEPTGTSTCPPTMPSTSTAGFGRVGAVFSKTCVVSVDSPNSTEPERFATTDSLKSSGPNGTAEVDAHVSVTSTSAIDSPLSSMMTPTPG